MQITWGAAALYTILLPNPPPVDEAVFCITATDTAPAIINNIWKLEPGERAGFKVGESGDWVRDDSVCLDPLKIS
jgi:hypothetical protein